MNPTPIMGNGKTYNVHIERIAISAILIDMNM